MNGKEMAVVIEYIEGQWKKPLTDNESEIYGFELKDLDLGDVWTALHVDFAEERFPPTAMMLRSAVLRQGQEVSWQALMDELMTKIQTVGWPGTDGYGKEPEWSHSAIGDFVRQNGGWLAVCQHTDERGTSTTQTAQYRDHLKTVIARHDREVVHAALGRWTEQPAIEMPDLRYRDGEADG